jgi:hypothetical protein
MKSLAPYLFIFAGVYILWILGPVINYGLTQSAIHDSGFRIAVSASFLISYFFRLLFPSFRCKKRWRFAVNSLSIIQLVTIPLGAVLCFINLKAGLLFLLLGISCSILVIYFYPRAISPEHKFSPAREIYNQGVEELRKEKDPVERRKLIVALKKWKDDWRLK